MLGEILVLAFVVGGAARLFWDTHVVVKLIVALAVLTALSTKPKAAARPDTMFAPASGECTPW